MIDSMRNAVRGDASGVPQGFDAAKDRRAASPVQAIADISPVPSIAPSLPPVSPQCRGRGAGLKVKLVLEERSKERSDIT
jgi:hypothetical protein